MRLGTTVSQQLLNTRQTGVRDLMVATSQRPGPTDHRTNRRHPGDIGGLGSPLEDLSRISEWSNDEDPLVLQNHNPKSAPIASLGGSRGFGQDIPCQVDSAALALPPTVQVW